MKTALFSAVILTALTAGPASAETVVWKDYSNALVGIELKIRNTWQQIELKETSQTGLVAFNVSRSPDPHASVSAQRQKVDLPFDVYTSSEILTQMFEPGYSLHKTNFAGRSCVKIMGIGKGDGRKQETYYSNHAPFIDDITFAAPPDHWERFTPVFEEVKKTIRWTRPVKADKP